MNGLNESNQRVTGLIPFRVFLKDMGKSETTGWRWRRDGLVQCINICGKIYISLDEVQRFEERAKRGQFSKAIPVPKYTAKSPVE